MIADERGKLIDGDQLMASSRPAGTRPASSPAAASSRR